MQARMTLGASPSGGALKIEQLTEVVEECERMGWEAHIEYQAYNVWEIVFTREIQTKEMKNQ